MHDKSYAAQDPPPDAKSVSLQYIDDPGKETQNAHASVLYNFLP